MKRRFPLMILCCVSILVLTYSCTENDQNENSTIDNDTLEESSSDNFTHETTDARCFLGETPFSDGSGDKDVSELRLEINGEEVTGIYNWLPAFKDGTQGTIEGSLTDGIITGDYVYMQEGEEFTEAIEIRLADNIAIVNQLDTIPAADCKL